MREFGQAVTYTPIAGDPASIVAVFDAAYQVVLPGGEAEVDAAGPVLGVRLADLAGAPARGDAVTIGASAYTVRSVHPDGQGGAKLLLTPAA